MKTLDPEFVKEEFNKRALGRKGIDKVLSARFSHDVNEKFHKYLDNLLKKHFKKKMSNALEVGVGIGRLAEYFSKISDRYVGMDFSVEMLSCASESLHKKGVDNVELILGDVARANIDFLPKYFDLGVVSLVLKHNNDEQAIKIIERLKKWCKKVLLVDHVSGGATGSNIAIIRDKEWYIKKFKPMNPKVIADFKRAEDNISFVLFE